MHALPPRQARALAAILDIITTTGAAPTQAKIAEAADLKTAVGKVLGELHKGGYISQPWEGQGAPWLPVRGLDGQPVKVRAVVEVAP